MAWGGLGREGGGETGATSGSLSQAPGQFQTACVLLEGPPSQGAQQSITFEASVGLNDELPGFLAEQHRVPEREEALGGRIGDSGIPLIQGPASSHVPCGLQHLWEGSS